MEGCGAGEVGGVAGVEGLAVDLEGSFGEVEPGVAIFC